MKRRIFAIVAAILIIPFIGCASKQHIDPAGTATTKFGINDTTLAALPESISRSDLENLFGPGEQQPGPRVTYKASDHPGMYYWIYFHERGDAKNQTFVRYIVLGDSIEEKNRVVWPARFAGISPDEIPQ